MPIMLTRKDGPPTPFRNAEYIPFYYFITKSILSRCVAELNAIERELRQEQITEAKVLSATRLPLTWLSEQKADFKHYLLQSSEVSFTFRNRGYHIKIVGAEIYPQMLRCR